MTHAGPTTIRFEPLRDGAIKHWSKPRSFDFLDRLPTAPIADTELLHLSHYCPIVIALNDDGPAVVILLDPGMLQSASVDRNGRWRAPYVPIALRSLPFWPGARPSEIHIAPELADTAAGASFALHNGDGRPSEPFGAVATWIERLQQGMRRLGEAAQVLVAADLLEPLIVQEAALRQPIETGYFTISTAMLHTLAPTRMAALTCDKCLPLDLVTACVFSRRLLHRRVVPKKADTEASRARHADETELDFMRRLDIKLRLDNSPLFSFEDFVGTAAIQLKNPTHASS